MNQFSFAFRNVLDKFVKIRNDPQIAKYYWQTYIVGKFRQIDPDVYIVSYPKCGRTWLRMLIQNYLSTESNESSAAQSKFLLSLPDGTTIKFDHDQGTWIPAPVLTTKLAINQEKFAGKKVVFLYVTPGMFLFQAGTT